MFYRKSFSHTAFSPKTIALRLIRELVVQKAVSINPIATVLFFRRDVILRNKHVSCETVLTASTLAVTVLILLTFSLVCK